MLRSVLVTNIMITKKNSFICFFSSLLVLDELQGSIKNKMHENIDLVYFKPI